MPAESREHAADGVHRGGVERNRNAGVERGVRIAADGEGIAAEFRVLQDDVHEQPRTTIRIQSTNGTPSTVPSPRNEKCRGIWWTGKPFEMISVKPRTIPSVPSVTMNGLIRSSRGQQAIHEAPEGSGEDADQHADGNRLPLLHRHGAQQTAHRENGADRQIDAAGDDDQRHAQAP